MLVTHPAGRRLARRHSEGDVSPNGRSATGHVQRAAPHPLDALPQAGGASDDSDDSAFVASIDISTATGDPQVLLTDFLAGADCVEHFKRYARALDRIKLFVRTNALPASICDSLDTLMQDVYGPGCTPATKWQFHARTSPELQTIAKILDGQAGRPDNECLTAIAHWKDDLPQGVCVPARLGHIQRTLQELQGLRGGFEAASALARRNLQNRIVVRQATDAGTHDVEVHAFQSLQRAMAEQLAAGGPLLHDQFSRPVSADSGAAAADEVRAEVTPEAIAAEMAFSCLDKLRGLLASRGIEEPLPADAWLAFDPTRTQSRDPGSPAATLIEQFGNGFTPGDLFDIDVADEAMPGRVSATTALLAHRFLQRMQRESGTGTPPTDSLPMPQGETLEWRGTSILTVRMADGRMRRLTGTDLQQLDPHMFTGRPEFEAAVVAEAFANTDAAGRRDWPVPWLSNEQAARLVTGGMSRKDFDAFVSRLAPALQQMSLQARCDLTMALSGGKHRLYPFMHLAGLVQPRLAPETRTLLERLLCANRLEPALAVLRGLRDVDVEPTTNESLVLACVRAGRHLSVEILLAISPNFGKYADAVPGRRGSGGPGVWQELVTAAALNGRIDVLLALNRAGQLEYDYKPLVEHAIQGGNVDFLETVHELAQAAGEPDGLDRYPNEDWVMQAAGQEKPAMLAYLSRRGVNMNRKMAGLTPLGMAFGRNDMEMASLLVRLGARVV